MLRNYIIIAWRILWHNKVFSAINIFGLAVGMAAALILFQYVRFEQNYDAFHEKADQIYRTTRYYLLGGVEYYGATNNPGAGPMLKEELPEVSEYVRFFKHSIVCSACILTYQPEYSSVRQFNEDQEKVYYADPAVFKMFSFPLLKGSQDDALKEPNTVALSESTVQRYFGKQDPVGKIIHIEDWINAENKNFMVTAIFKNVPVNSHLQFDILISFATLKASERLNLGLDLDNWWMWPSFNTYVLLKEGTDPFEVEERALPFYELRMEKVKEIQRANYGDDVLTRFPLQPIKDIHLNPINNLVKRSDMDKLYLLMLIGIMIIFIACINYINLSTANAAQRSREVGMRKVMGSNRTQLISQFIIESIIINLLAVIIALTLIQITGSSFNQLIQKEVITVEMFDLKFLGVILITTIFCILVSGFYPAVVLSSFKPVISLKGQLDKSSRRFSFRNLLIIFQFSASVILISSVYTLSRQLSFMNNIDLGFNKDQILTLKVPSQQQFEHRLESFKQELVKKMGILNACNTANLPGMIPINMSFKGIHQTEVEKASRFFSIDDGYLNTFGIELIKGRNFGPDINLDHDAVLINELALENFGFESLDEAIDAEILWTSRKNIRLRVIGVVKDYYHMAPKWGVEPIVMQNRGYANELTELENRVWPGKYLSLKVRSQNLQKTIQTIQTEWDEVFPEAPFDYFFLDENYNIQYGQDQQEARIFGIFSVLAVIIACMGLFGLTLYATIRRTKEIGIRKVMGAPITNILQLLTKESGVLLIISSVIAIPFAYWFVNNQLQEYANRINITPWLFIVPVLMVILISLFTVAFQTIKTALANPVEALRYE
jgi:putative ABC transport system permease protein